MTIISCPICKSDVTINIGNAVDEHGEEFICPVCRKTFRYAPNG